MAGWAKRFGSWASGQISPFGGPSRPDGDSNQIKDSDFSYITEEDLQNVHKPHHHHHTDGSRPPRDTDVITFRHRNKQQQVHFAAWSISDGDLTVGAVRDKIASRLEVGDARRIRLFWKGRNLKTDSRTLHDEGMHSEDNIEMLCVVGDKPLEGSADADDSGSEASADGEEGVESGTGGEGQGRKKKRKNKKKKGRKTGGSSTPPTPGYSTAGAGAEHLPMPSGLHPAHRESSTAPSPARGPSPQPKQPQTPMGKLQAIEDKYRSELVPGAEAFMANPPSDPAKMQFEHKKFAETIMAQVVLKLDGVEVEGDPDARAKRKALVKETQAFLTRLDEVVKQ